MIDIALKEWSCVCDLLVEGKACLLLRKGGVHEDGGPGRFKLEHHRFALFPAWEHETLEWIKPELRPSRGEIAEEPSEIELKGYAEVAGIWEVPTSGGGSVGRESFDQLDDLHPWLSPQIDMRFDYKPERPLYAMVVKAYRFDVAKLIPNRREFAGCKSWVPLAAADAIQALDLARVKPALNDTALAQVIARVGQVLAG